MNQRERLYGATVAVVAKKGYAETSVKDLIEVAGLSRTSFYRYFADKEACFLATLDVLLEGASGVPASRVRRDGSWEERAEHGLAGFIELVVDQPDAARLAMVEAYAAGDAARERVDATVATLIDLAIFVFDQMPERRGMPDELIAALIGSMRKIVHTRLHRHAEPELTAIVPDLIRWAMVYRPPPQPLRAKGAWGRHRAKPDPERQISKVPASKIEAATLALVAELGYAYVPITAIAAAARVSLATFYDCFDGKGAALQAALYRKQLEVAAVSLPAYRRARSWPEAIRAIMVACLEYFETEPEFTRVATVDIYAAGTAALEMRDRVIESTRRFIEDGGRYSPPPDPVVSEAIQSGLYAMVQDRVRTKGTKGLRTLAPPATYLALAPFLDPAEAAAVANGGRPVRREWRASEDQSSRSGPGSL